MAKNNFHFIVQSLGIEAQNLADQMGVTRQTVTDWIMERKAIPTKRIEELSNILGVEEKYLYNLHSEIPLKEKIKIFENHISNILGIEIRIVRKKIKTEEES